ncbi:hypothetical protein EYZ11_006824 [Aspergillus tanneri]|nr:hypothetical protein EYZ11_006824 [Aspergillus tanneri]
MPFKRARKFKPSDTLISGVNGCLVDKPNCFTKSFQFAADKPGVKDTAVAGVALNHSQQNLPSTPEEVEYVSVSMDEKPSEQDARAC